MKQHLNVTGPEAADVEALKLEVTELRQKCEQLQEENNELKAKVSIIFMNELGITLVVLKVSQQLRFTLGMDKLSYAYSIP